MDPLCPRETIKHAVAELRTQLVGSYLLDMEEWISIYSCPLSNLTRSFSFVTHLQWLLQDPAAKNTTFWSKTASIP